MFKKYLIAQLTQISAWIGLAVVLSAFFLPRSFITFLGIALILTDDVQLAALFAKWAPGVKAKIDAWK